jgi:hypothetical protein
LLHDTVLAAEDNTHATQVPNFGLAYHQGVNVEPPASKDSRDAGEYTRLVLNEAIEDMPKGS